MTWLVLNEQSADVRLIIQEPIVMEKLLKLVARESKRGHSSPNGYYFGSLWKPINRALGVVFWQMLDDVEFLNSLRSIWEVQVCVRISFAY